MPAQTTSEYASQIETQVTNKHAASKEGITETTTIKIGSALKTQVLDWREHPELAEAVEV